MNKNIIISFLIAMIVACSAQTVLAQNQRISLHSLEDALALSLRQNTDLAVYKLNQEKANQELKNQKLAYIPTSSFTLGAQYNIDRQTSVLPGEIFGKPGQTVNVQMGTDYAYNPGINLNWDVFNYQLPLKTRLSQIDTELQSAQIDAFRQKLTEQTANFYYVALIIQQAIAINHQNLQSSDSILHLTEQKFKEGLVDLSAVNQAKIAVNNVEQTLKGNEKSLEMYLHQLKNLLGLQEEDSLTFDEKIGLDKKITSLTWNLNEDKNLAVYSLRKKQSLADIQLKKAAFYPKLTLNGYLGYQQFTNDFGLKFSDNSWNKYNYVALNLSVPITNNFKNRGGLKTAEINDKINAQILNNEQLKSHNQDAYLLKEYNNHSQQLEIAENTYHLFKENVDLAFQKYNNGLISLDNYLKINEDYLKAETTYLNMLANVYANYSTIYSRQ